MAAVDRSGSELFANTSAPRMHTRCTHDGTISHKELQRHLTHPARKYTPSQERDRWFQVARQEAGSGGQWDARHTWLLRRGGCCIGMSSLESSCCLVHFVLQRLDPSSRLQGHPRSLRLVHGLHDPGIRCSSHHALPRRMLSTSPQTTICGLFAKHSQQHMTFCKRKPWCCIWPIPDACLTCSNVGAVPFTISMEGQLLCFGAFAWFIFLQRAHSRNARARHSSAARCSIKSSSLLSREASSVCRDSS